MNNKQPKSQVKKYMAFLILGSLLAMLGMLLIFVAGLENIQELILR